MEKLCKHNNGLTVCTLFDDHYCPSCNAYYYVSVARLCLPVQENEELGEGITKETFDLPKGWEWISEWSYDINRAVSELGWEYTSDAADGPWTPVEKVMHVCRRRRWVRTRKLVEEPEPEKVRYLHSF